MQQTAITYKCGETPCRGVLVHDENITTPRPAVIVAHAWRGQDDFARHKAVDLAKLGYIAFAADIYGQGIEVKTDEEAQALMLPLFMNRQLLRERIVSAYDTVSNLPYVDKGKIGAIGFCFGGLTVIELLRSGRPARGVVSFHGVLGNTLKSAIANTQPPAKSISGSLLILHGNLDPLVSQNDILAIQSEFTQLGVDWQMHIYGHTVHAFTNPEVSDFKNGMAYDKLADRRSWKAMCNFFQEIFQQNRQGQAL
jgi:dienelactone hydrolase